MEIIIDDLGWPELAQEVQKIDAEVAIELEEMGWDAGFDDLYEKHIIANPSDKLLREIRSREEAFLFSFMEMQKVVHEAALVCPDVLPNHDMDRNQTMAHRPQTRGDSDSSDDHDSHILAYRHHLGALICWTSAMEVLAVILPTTKLFKKHTYLISNYHLDLVDYPADFTPEYSPETLRRAATASGVELDFAVLQNAIQSGHRLHKLFSKFPLPAYPGGPAYPNGVEDYSWLAQQRDPDGEWYRIVTWVAKYVCRAWATDPLHGDDIVQDIITGTYSGVLRNYDPNNGQLGSYAGLWARSSLRDALVRLKITIPRTSVRKRLTLAEQVFVRHADAEPAANAPDGVKAVWDHRRRHLQAAVDRYKTTIGGRVVVGADSLDAPLSDAEGSISVVDTLMGDTGDMVDSLESAAVIADVRNLFAGPVISDLLEKLSTVSKSTMGCEDHPLEFLAGVISQNKKALAIIKNSIGPDGLAQLARHI
ncbi:MULTISPECIES: hypothetical protein [Acidithiobacillus]|jgi:hypothetical protein|uniref:hypothetical protein n=1 Tax=Acidithiobacillus TaxID=119977 RepID=UPI001C070281|nr:hypothetical protein [Acidithiobacillus ferrooxidans]MBU2809767.1 hypothetical protein [Acidithiobacillus ferrooxidans F221]